MNKHDTRRRDALIRTLEKAKEQAETTSLYLFVRAPMDDETAKVSLVLEHLEIALGHLKG